MPTQFTLWHLTRLNAFTRQIIPHPDQHLPPDPSHLAVDIPH